MKNRTITAILAVLIISQIDSLKNIGVLEIIKLALLITAIALHLIDTFTGENDAD